MHNLNNNIQVLAFGNVNFTNSLTELKDNLNFTLNTCKEEEIKNFIKNNTILLVHEDFLKKNNSIEFIKSIKNIKVLFYHLKNIEDIDFNLKIALPTSLIEINNKIIELGTRKEFLLNSAILIKDYVLNKNEKKLNKFNKSVTLTEKEVQLLELFLNENKHLTKNQILKIIWKYSEDADTHTVETHIYRLRKKINDTFKDNFFILNDKQGYFI